MREGHNRRIGEGEFDCVLLPAPALPGEFFTVNDHVFDSGKTADLLLTMGAKYSIPLSDCLVTANSPDPFPTVLHLDRTWCQNALKVIDKELHTSMLNLFWWTHQIQSPHPWSDSHRPPFRGG